MTMKYKLVQNPHGTDPYGDIHIYKGPTCHAYFPLDDKPDRKFNEQQHAIALAVVAMLNGEVGVMAWIDWQGGECPCPGRNDIEVKWRSGTTSHLDISHREDWQHLGEEDDIVAYRVNHD